MYKSLDSIVNSLINVAGYETSFADTLVNFTKKQIENFCSNDYNSYKSNIKKDGLEVNDDEIKNIDKKCDMVIIIRSKTHEFI